jgi:amidohydrolase
MKNKILLFLTVLIPAVTILPAQTTNRIRQMAYADSLRLTGIFIDIHENPELGFMEVRTSGIVAKELKTLGYQVITGIAKTGVVGIFKNGDGPTVMYRADMDCNSVKEITGFSYASTKTMKKEDGTETPVMHACGHDAHVTWMLGIAKIMMSLKSEWKGTLVFLAQPAEELVKGAQAMVNDSMYAKGVPVPDYLFGMHTASDFPVGQISNGTGVRMAGTDQLDVTFYGVGAHGASPQYAKDPILMACNAVLQYQTIISRNISAQDVAVLTVGAIQAGSDNNVIPASSLLKISLRWFDEKTRKTLLDGIKRINEGIAVANGLSTEQYPTIKIKGSAFPLQNNIAMTDKVNAALSSVMGTDNIIVNRRPAMYSEDFQSLIYGNNKSVSDYMLVGTANPVLFAKAISEGKTAPFNHHAGNFQVDISTIPLGTEIGAVALLAIFKN